MRSSNLPYSSTSHTRQPRILFFIPTLLVGGAERHTVDLCDRLRSRGYSASILVHQDRISPVITEAPSGADAIVLGLKGMSDVRGWFTIWRLLRRLRPDVIVAVNQTPFIITAVERLAFATRAKLACVFHTTELQHYEKYQEKLFLKLARFADLLVYVGENQRRSWEKRGAHPTRSVVIPNGVDAARFEAARATRDAVRQRLGVASNAYLLGILASFRTEKNHSSLIEAVGKVRDAGLELSLACIGEGPTRPAVEEQARQLNVADRIIFVGEQSDVAPLLAACDAGVLCSTIETFPLSAIEFLAAGVPMIAADVGGVPEIVQHDFNGLLYRSGDPSALADAIISLAEPWRRSTLAARAASSVAPFSAEQMADRYVEEFDALFRA